MTNPELIRKLKGENPFWARQDAARLLMMTLHRLDRENQRTASIRKHYDNGCVMLRIMRELLDADALDEDGIEELKAIWDGLFKSINGDLHFHMENEDAAFAACMNDLFLSLMCVGFHPGMNRDSQSQ